MLVKSKDSLSLAEKIQNKMEPTAAKRDHLMSCNRRNQKLQAAESVMHEYNLPIPKELGAELTELQTSLVRQRLQLQDIRRRNARYRNALNVLAEIG